ncbi:hypothetical protein [Lactobacillus helveticus]|uniref:hypothetical protein n=1 Tax=Lactobacillus helveticus TaxID=1587 RepID=UPI001F31CE9B|nr:hypothetical protein [Lactobacillus helveticus]
MDQDLVLNKISIKLLPLPQSSIQKAKTRQKKSNKTKVRFDQLLDLCHFKSGLKLKPQHFAISIAAKKAVTPAIKPKEIKALNPCGFNSIAVDDNSTMSK